MSQYHEPIAELSEEARNFSRALNSLKEEIEAVDWYNQRVDVAPDEELKGILAHNRDEEIEHACMVIEWLRRHMPGWDAELRNWLFKDGKILDAHGDDPGDEKPGESPEDLGIGKLS